MIWFGSTLALMGLYNVAPVQGLPGDQPVLRIRFLIENRRASRLSRWGRRAFGDGRGGAVRRHGALRAMTDSPGLVRLRAAVVGHQLFRPGALLLPTLPWSITRSITWRQTGCCFRWSDWLPWRRSLHRRPSFPGAFSVATGVQAGLPAAFRGCSTLRNAGAGLSSPASTGGFCRRRDSGARFPVDEQPGGGLWHRGDRRHGHHLVLATIRRAKGLGAGAGPRAMGLFAVFLAVGTDFLFANVLKIPGWRLVPLAAGSIVFLLMVPGSGAGRC